MPVSLKQLRWAHTANGKKALGSNRISEWDAEAKGKSLPERSNGKGPEIEKSMISARRKR